MAKWLGAGALGLLILLFLLWRTLDEPAEALPPPRVAPKPTDTATLIAQAEANMTQKPARKGSASSDPAKAPGEKEVMDPASELFDKHFIDIIPKRLWKEAAVCYEGKLGTKHRNQSIRYNFTVSVKKGKVTIKDFRLAKDDGDDNPANTINDPGLESCFHGKLSGYTWNGDDDMPDGYTIPDYEYPDELVINPERSKKYYKDNMDYVGGEAPSRGGHAYKDKRP